MPKETHLALISLTSILMVLLLGAVVVMGSLIHQFASGRNSLQSPNTQMPNSPATVMIGPNTTGGDEVEPPEQDAFSSTDIARNVLPALCTVQCYSNTHELVAGYVGVVMTTDGYIATSMAAVQDDWVMSVVLSSGESLQPEVVASDKTTGLVVLKVNAQNLRYAEIGDSSGVAIGDSVIAFGIIGKSNITMTEGIVGTIGGFDVETDRAYGRYMRFIVTDAALAGDFNNTVLVNRSGQVVGISGVCVKESESVGRYALPFNDVLPAVSSIVSYGYVAPRPALGLDISTVDSAAADQANLPTGVRVDAVLRADDTGLLPGDIITAIDNVGVASAEQLTTLVSLKPASGTVELAVFRPGTNETLTLAVPLLQDDGS